MKKKKIKLTSNISQRQYDKLLKALFNRIKSDEKCFIKLSNSLEYQQKRWELAEQKHELLESGKVRSTYTAKRKK